MDFTFIYSFVLPIIHWIVQRKLEITEGSGHMLPKINWRMTPASWGLLLFQSNLKPDN